ncbi:HdeD family acid-resistance protein [Nonomuraea sp. NPDC050663]|uniref:HdeD family acid-resistance protein n=1 Tax=Nonomuraea sp. NPDC050663 TaxID=3364370 RepID=UPI0037A8A6D0
MEQLSSVWWLVLIRGIFGIIFGLIALIWTGDALLVLIFVFGAYALVEGVFDLYRGFRGHTDNRGWLIFIGIVGIIAGIIAFVRPGLAGLTLLYIIAFWAIFAGITGIVAGIRMRKVITNEWMFIVSGALTLLFGILLVIWPLSGALSLVWLLGLLSLIYGIVLVILSFKVKNLVQ